MYKIKSAIILAAASLTFGAAHASTPNTANQEAALKVIMSGTSEAGLIPCHNTFANCLVTLIGNTMNEGFVVIFNSSTVTVHNVKATLPASWGTDVVETSLSPCTDLEPEGNCEFRFQSVANTPHAKATIPVKGDNTTTVFFDMKVDAAP